MKLYALLNIILCFSSTICAQVVNNASTIEFGSKNLSLEEPLLISVVLRDAENRPSVIFPEIKNLEKRSKSATSSISIVDGQKVVIQTITQEYYASKPGSYLVPQFFLTVNGQRLHAEETLVVFSARKDTENPVAAETPNLESDFEPNKEDIFLSVQTDKKQVFIRQGFALRISLYIAENTPVEMEFYRFNEQLQTILKAVKPTTCWEENVGIEEIIKRKVTIRGRKYTEYNMYQARLFPITTEDIQFPSVKLEMLVKDNSSAVNVDKKVLKAFRSKANWVKVEQLPDHPLRDQVAVGQYSLNEKLSAELVYPGESVRYMFKVEGVGNIAAIPAPTMQPNSSFDIYPPEVSQIIKRSNQSVIGEKTFDYFVVPRKDGSFPLGRYFQWVYFNSAKARYDTLRSAKSLQVRGEDYKLANLAFSGSSGLYDNLESLDSTSERFDFKQILKEVTNAIVVVLLITMFWVLRK
ncbi:BatD family protein [Dyadobacter sp. CY323]|uniref:BatD family protein n=1 Tax=Dyadobacter sp. CY323 TaxID=2907302 RepID=UPI001F2E13B9|nr:BatD family protein [Dyadobacter sp. CY323]MCE6990627.1 BatD family protein [Dyadobacter sp. CY323]